MSADQRRHRLDLRPRANARHRQLKRQQGCLGDAGPADGVELGPDGIRCNSVSPGSTQTGISSCVLGDPTVRTRRGAMLPLGRIGQPDDVAHVTAFLVGPDAAYVTGADLLVGGGLNLTLMDWLVERTRMRDENPGLSHS